jgi:hypothetical protein
MPRWMDEVELWEGLPVFVGTTVPIDTFIAHMDADGDLTDFPDRFPSVLREQAESVWAGLTVRSIPRARAIHGDRLHRLVGSTIERSWVVWGEGRPHSPLVLGIGGERLELQTVYICEFEFSWNSIDLSKPRSYWNEPPWDEYRWAEDATAVLRSAMGQVVRGVSLLSADGWCGGIEFTLDRGPLIVANLDELLITDDPSRTLHKRIELGSK